MGELRIGDVVQLKSGGPEMTIREIDNYSGGGPKDEALCEWFAETTNKRATFKLTSLLKLR